MFGPFCAFVRNLVRCGSGNGMLAQKHKTNGNGKKRAYAAHASKLSDPSGRTQARIAE